MQGPDKVGGPVCVHRGRSIARQPRSINWLLERIVAIAGVLMTFWFAVCGQTDSAGSPVAGLPLVSSKIEDRIVKVFDFDEQDLGNYETMPRYWRQIDAAGYPRFLEPAFDFEVGHEAPPSFKLSLEGGSAGAYYLAKDINVHPDADYRIIGWIRPAGLAHAQASLAAYFLDHALHKIEQSERRSRLVRGPTQTEPWRQVVVDLPGGFERARWIGLTCQIEQPLPRAAGVDDLRPINYRDTHGTAWFDDIQVIRLPRVTLELDAPAGIFDKGRPPACLIRVADVDGSGLDASLTIRDAEQNVVWRQPVTPIGLHDNAVRFELGELPAGWYQAQIGVACGATPLVERRASFLCLNADLPGASRGGRGFGAVLDGPIDLDKKAMEHLLRALGVGIVKLPLWHRDLEDAAVVSGDARLDRLLRVLPKVGADAVATLQDPPGTLAQQCGHPRLRLLDVLSSDAAIWRPYLALMLARYGQHVLAWQVGADGRLDLMEDGRLGKAVATVRDELKALIGPAKLVAPHTIVSSLSSEALPVDVAAIWAPQSFSAEQIGGQLKALETADSPLLWTTLELPDPHRYDRLGRLTELARRLVAARCAGAEEVFVQQPWKARAVLPSDRGDQARQKDVQSVGIRRADESACATTQSQAGVPPVGDRGAIASPLGSERPADAHRAGESSALDDGRIDPSEDFIIVRTLAQALGGLKPVSSVWLGQGIEAWLFQDAASQDGAVVAWSTGDAAGPAEVVLDFGPQAMQIDVWGNVSQAPSASDGRRFLLGAMPSIIAPISPSRVLLMAGFAVGDPVLQSSVDQQFKTLLLTNPGPSLLLGRLSLEPPPGWTVEPSKLLLNVGAGQTLRQAVSFQIPTNQGSGDYTLVGRLSVGGKETSEIVLRTALKVGAPALIVNVMARREADDLVIYHRVTNQSDQPLNLRATVVAPQRPRQTRLLTDLAPSRSAVREYRLSRASSLRGKYVRISLEQIGGPLRHNEVIKLD